MSKEEFSQELIKDEVEAMKDRVAKGTTITGAAMQPIENSTIGTRSIKNQSINSPPLNASGKLLNSIKAVKKGISLKKYGLYHSKGYTPKFIPTFLSQEIVKKAKKKRKIPLVKNTKGIKVPARTFMHTSATFTINKKLLNKFIKGIHRALKK